MSIVTIKNKYQVVIPQRVREQVGVRIGDLLEAQADKGKIVFTPKSIVDRALAEGIVDPSAGAGITAPFFYSAGRATVFVASHAFPSQTSKALQSSPV